MYIRRTLLSMNTLIAALVIFALFTFTGVVAQDVVNSYKVGSDYREMLVFLSAFPAVGVFVQDWHTQFWRLLAVRMPIQRYARRIFVWVWITTLCTAMLGQWLYIFYLQYKVPVLSDITYTQPWEFDFLGQILLYDHPYWYLLAQTLCASLVCGSLAVLSLLVSVKLPDRLVVGFAPLILYYFLSFGLEIARFPHFLRLDHQLIGYLTGTPWVDMLIMSTHLVIPLVILPMFVVAVEGRCSNA